MSLEVATTADLPALAELLARLPPQEADSEPDLARRQDGLRLLMSLRRADLIRDPSIAKRMAATGVIAEPGEGPRPYARGGL
jgi:hypothetical protein